MSDQRQYLIGWKGYSYEDDSRESVSHSDTQDVVKKYHKAASILCVQSLCSPPYPTIPRELLIGLQISHANPMQGQGTFQGGRLILPFLERTRSKSMGSFSAKPWVLPSSTTPSKNKQLSREEEVCFEREVKRLEEMDVLEEGEVALVSKIRPHPKKEKGKFRLVDLIGVKHSQGKKWAVTIDQGYYHIPVAEGFRKFLGIC